MKFLSSILMISRVMSLFSIRYIKRTKSVYLKAINHFGSSLMKDSGMNDKGLWTLQFDGGSRGNPGFAGSGSVIIHSTVDPNPKLTSNIDYAAKTMKIGRNNEKDDGNEIFDLKREHWYGYNYLGDYKTSNEAEYSGLIEGLEQVVKMNLTSIVIQGDSQLILKQVEGTFKVKNENLKLYHAKATKLLKRISNYSFEYIPRARNSRADALANMAMDQRANFSLPMDNFQLSNFNKDGNYSVDIDDEFKLDVTHVNDDVLSQINEDSIISLITILMIHKEFVKKNKIIKMNGDPIDAATPERGLQTINEGTATTAVDLTNDNKKRPIKEKKKKAVSAKNVIKEKDKNDVS